MKPEEILRGVAVAEFASSLAIRYGSKLLQSLGATVYSVDGLLGRRQDNAFEAWLDDRKLKYEHDPVDIAFVEEPGTDHAAMVSILVEPFGSGPYETHAYDEVVPLALSGWLSIAGRRERAPLLHSLPLPSLSAGANAAVAALIAALGKASGEGTGLASVSVLDTMHRMLGPWMFYYPWTGFVPGRLAFNGSRAGFLLKCEDGYVASMVARPDWDILAALTGSDDLRDDKWRDAAYAVENRRLLWSILQESLGDRTKKQLVEEASSLGFPWGDVQEREEIIECPQLMARGFWSEGEKLSPGLPFKVMEYIEAKEGDPAEHDTNLPHGQGPLTGLTVIELSVAWAGPFIGRILADAGATVIKVESGRKPDAARALPLIENQPGDHWWDRCIAYSTANGAKYHIGLELDKEGGREVLLGLLGRADVLINNHAHRVLRNLGLTFEALASANPNILYLTSSGFGLGGPYEDRTSLGWTIEAMCGITASHGYQPDEPHWSKMPFPDVFGALHGAVAIAAGLHATRKRPGALWLDLSQYESGVHAALPAILQPSFREELDPAASESRYIVRGVYPCLDDEWIAIAIDSKEQWSQLCEVMDRAELTSVYDRQDSWSQSSRAPIDEAITVWASRLAKRDAEKQLQAVRVPAGAVLNGRDSFFDPHHRKHNYVCDLSREVGSKPWPGPWQAHERSQAAPGYAPSTFGQHNELLMDWLGLDPEELDRLRRSGAVVDVPSYATGPTPTALDVERLVKMGEFESQDPSYLADVADFCR